MTLKFKLCLDFLIMHLPTKFYHPMFNRSEIIMFTNKQTSTSLCYAMPLENYLSKVEFQHTHN